MLNQLKRFFNLPARLLRKFLDYRIGQKTYSHKGYEFSLTETEGMETLTLAVVIWHELAHAKSEQDIGKLLGSLMGACVENLKVQVPEGTPKMTLPEKMLVMSLVADYLRDVQGRQLITATQFAEKMTAKLSLIVDRLPKELVEHIQATWAERPTK